MVFKWDACYKVIEELLFDDKVLAREQVTKLVRKIKLKSGSWNLEARVLEGPYTQI